MHLPVHLHETVAAANDQPILGQFVGHDIFAFPPNDVDVFLTNFVQKFHLSFGDHEHADSHTDEEHIVPPFASCITPCIELNCLYQPNGVSDAGNCAIAQAKIDESAG